MAIKNKNIRPFKVVHPGSILKDELEARGMNATSFSRESGIDKDELLHFLGEESNLTQQMASKLESALLIPASFWMSLQKAYEQDCEMSTSPKNSKGHSFMGQLPWNRVAL